MAKAHERMQAEDEFYKFEEKNKIDSSETSSYRQSDSVASEDDYQ